MTNRLKRGWFLCTAVGLLLSLLIIELAGRALAYYRTVSGHDFSLRILEKFPQRDLILADRRGAATCFGLKYYDYYIYGQTPCQGRATTFSSYFSARNVPDSEALGIGYPSVWLFGGSTMMNMGTTDDLTIANTVAKTLRGRGLNPTVVNFGEGSYQSSVELIKFGVLLRRNENNLRPTHVVFYDGYNDSAHAYSFGAGNLQGDLSAKLEALVTRNYGTLALYAASEVVAKYSTFWDYFVSPRINWRLFGRNINDDSLGNLAKAVSIYIDNVRMLRGICREYKITCLFVLQPVLASKRQLTAFEQEVQAHLDPALIKFMARYYEAVKIQLGGQVDFIDLSGILDDSDIDDFYDYGHTSPYTSARIGRALGDAVAYTAKPRDVKSVSQ